MKFFQKESGHEQVTGLLGNARRIETPILLNAINLGEIIYDTKRSFGDQKFRKVEHLVYIVWLKLGRRDEIKSSLLISALGSLSIKRSEQMIYFSISR